MPTGFISAIVVGASIGWLASIVAQTNVRMGCLWNVVLGVIGATLGHLAAATLMHTGLLARVTLIGFLAGVGGALLPVAIVGAIGMRRTKKP